MVLLDVASRVSRAGREAVRIEVSRVKATRGGLHVDLGPTRTHVSGALVHGIGDQQGKSETAVSRSRWQLTGGGRSQVPPQPITSSRDGEAWPRRLQKRCQEALGSGSRQAFQAGMREIMPQTAWG